MMKLRRYCVTVMDHWTPMREFWTFGGALAFAARHLGASHLHVWNSATKTWEEIQRIWLRNIHDR